MPLGTFKNNVDNILMFFLIFPLLQVYFGPLFVPFWLFWSILARFWSIPYSFSIHFPLFWFIFDPFSVYFPSIFCPFSVHFLSKWFMIAPFASSWLREKWVRRASRHQMNRFSNFTSLKWRESQHKIHYLKTHFSWSRKLLISPEFSDQYFHYFVAIFGWCFGGLLVDFQIKFLSIL